MSWEDKTKNNLDFKEVKIIPTSNWRNGVAIDPKIQKKLCCVVFVDSEGIEHNWFPKEDKMLGDGDLNKILRVFIKVDKENIKNLSNPERRRDIEDMMNVLISYDFLEV